MRHATCKLQEISTPVLTACMTMQHVSRQKVAAHQVLQVAPQQQTHCMLQVAARQHAQISLEHAARQHARNKLQDTARQ
jgi:hypothetical protein